MAKEPISLIESPMPSQGMPLGGLGEEIDVEEIDVEEVEDPTEIIEFLILTRLCRKNFRLNRMLI